MKKTKWYPPEITPVHIGVYEVINGVKLYASYWDGKRWGCCVACLSKIRIDQDVIDTAEIFKDVKGEATKLFYWRGIQK